MGLGYGLNDREPESGAAGGAAGVGAGEPVEGLVNEIDGEPGPLVADRKLDPFVGSGGGDSDGAFAVPQGVR